MSYDICAFQDFETDATPWSVGGAGECTRSNVTPINGSWSMREQLDQISIFNPSPFVKIGHGSRKGMLFIARFQFKSVALPVGYSPVVIAARGTGSDAGGTDEFGIYRDTTAGKFRLYVANTGGLAAEFQDGGTAFSNGTYDLLFEARQERANGMRLQLYIGGVGLDATLVAATKQVLDIQACVVGGTSGGKGSGTDWFRDDMLINVGQDPS